MTTKGEWVEYTGSDEQIAELKSAAQGWVVRWVDGCESYPYSCSDPVEFANEQNGQFTNYWIIPDDPLREMKIRQAMTGQPVYVKTPSKRAKGKFSYYKATNPNWGEIVAEYSFVPFEE